MQTVKLDRIRFDNNESIYRVDFNESLREVHFSLDFKMESGSISIIERSCSCFQSETFEDYVNDRIDHYIQRNSGDKIVTEAVNLFSRYLMLSAYNNDKFGIDHQLVDSITIN